MAGVEALDAAQASRPIKVLVEIGIAERRGGLRGSGPALEVLEAAARARHVEPVGVECFEGVVGADRDEVRAVEEALERVADLAREGTRRGLFDGSRSWCRPAAASSSTSPRGSRAGRTSRWCCAAAAT